MTKELKDVLRNQASEIALVLGNGINRAERDGAASWENILKDLSFPYPRLEYHENKKIGLSLLELFELMEIAEKRGDRGRTRRRFMRQIGRTTRKSSSKFRDETKARLLVDWANRCGAPILTTNFDKNLVCALDLDKHKSDRPQTDHYPWSTYYAPGKIKCPLSEFAIWHMHGVVDYKRSVKLSLADYVGMVTKAKSFIHGSGGIFSVDQNGDWRGSKTWLDVFFRKKLLFIGLGLEPQEIFLRYMLLQRKKYFKHHGLRGVRTWFAIPQEEASEQYSGRQAFLGAIGAKTVVVPTHQSLYDSQVWKS